MQEYNEAEVARSGRKTRSSAGPLMAAGRNFADDDIHEYGGPGADDDEAEDVIDEDDDEVCGLIGCIRIVVPCGGQYACTLGEESVKNRTLV